MIKGEVKQMDLQELLKLIDTGRDVRRCDVLSIKNFVTESQFLEIVTLVRKLNLPKGTPKKVAKSFLLVGLATDFLSKERAKMYCDGLNGAWAVWNTVELEL